MSYTSTRKLLVITSKGDVHADQVITKLNEAGRKDKIIRLNTEDLLLGTKTKLSGSGLNITILDSKLRITNEESYIIWFRRPEIPNLLNDLDIGIKDFVNSELEGVLRSIYYSLHSSPHIWINDLLSMRRWRWKPLQLNLADKIGLIVPQWVITNDYDIFSEFKDKHSKVCIKHINTPIFHSSKHQAHAVYNRVLQSKYSKKQVESSYNFLQKYIDKSYEIRTTVIGDKVYSFKIESQSHELSQEDFRRLNPFEIKHSFTQLPKQIEDKIYEMMGVMGVKYGAFDFLVDKSGNIYFLEVNLNGQWLWLEKATGYDLTSKFIAYFEQLGLA